MGNVWTGLIWTCVGMNGMLLYFYSSDAILLLKMLGFNILSNVNSSPYPGILSSLVSMQFIKLCLQTQMWNQLFQMETPHFVSKTVALKNSEHAFSDFFKDP